MITHSMADLRALRNVEDRDKAKGFIERAGLVVCGGLPAQEVAELSEIVAFSRAERAQVTSWSTPPGWDVAALLAGGSLVGGYVGARVGRKLPDAVFRWAVVAAGVVAALLLF